MDDDDFEGFEVTPLPGRRFTLADFFVVILTFLGDLAAALAGAFNGGASLAAYHANYRADQERFREQAALEIEAMTGEETDG